MRVFRRKGAPILSTPARRKGQLGTGGRVEPFCLPLALPSDGFAAGEGGLDEVAEERVSSAGLGLEFRVELHSDIPRVVSHFDDFHQIALHVYASDRQALVVEELAIIVVELVAVALGNVLLAVGCGGAGAGRGMSISLDG